MKHTITILLSCLMSVSVFAAHTADEAFLAANKAYNAGHYEQAAQQYEAIVADGVESAALYYNLGDAYFRMGELGRSVLNFERARRLNPGDKDIRENLEFVYSKTEDQIQPLPQFFVVRWWNAVNSLTSTHGWANVTLVALLLACASAAVFFLSREYLWRKGSFVASVCFGVILVLAVANTASAGHKATTRQEAVVTAPMVEVKSSPDRGSVDKFVLHEGTKVQISDHVDNWIRIKIADGNRGWVLSADLTTI